MKEECLLLNHFSFIRIKLQASILGIYINYEGSHYSEIVFKEWREEEIFYERLVDGKEREEAIFKKYKKLMNEEFN